MKSYNQFRRADFSAWVKHWFTGADRPKYETRRYIKELKKYRVWSVCRYTDFEMTGGKHMLVVVYQAHDTGEEMMISWTTFNEATALPRRTHWYGTLPANPLE